MKTHFTTKCYIATFIFAFSFYQSNAQNDTLTLGQLFDLKTGDTLIYTGYDIVPCFGNMPYYGPNFYHGRWGFTVTGIYTSPDSISIYYTILETNLTDTLVVYNPASTLAGTDLICSYYPGKPYSQVFRWTFDGISYQGFSLYQLHSCDTSQPDITCTLQTGTDTALYNQTGNGIFSNSNDTIFPASHSGYYFVQHVGLVQATQTVNAPYCNDDATTASVMQLIYYHSGNTVWMDTADYLLSTGINQVSAAQAYFKLYPNPATDVLYLQSETNNFNGRGSIQIYNIQSQLLSVQALTAGKRMQQIEVGNLSPGLYLVNVVDDQADSIWRGTLVKM